MFFSGFQKLTLLDYPGKIACILFTEGCNFRCPFCHNASLVRCDDTPKFTTEEVIAFLKKRQGVLEGVCISGGEPLLQKELKCFLKEVKKLGYAVKLDTNGSFPQKLKELVDEQLVDYVAMDIKNSYESYNKTAGVNVNIEDIKKSVEYLLSEPVEYEFRTTMVKELHSEEDVQKMAEQIKGAQKYFLQNFVDSGDILCSNLTPFSEEEMKKMEKIACKILPNAVIRGL